MACTVIPTEIPTNTDQCIPSNTDTKIPTIPTEGGGGMIPILEKWLVSTWYATLEETYKVFVW